MSNNAYDNILPNVRPSSPIRMLAVTLGSAREASSRVRVYQCQSHLAASGIDVEIEPFYPARADGAQSSWPAPVARAATMAYTVRRTAALLAAARRADVVLLQRVLLPRPLLAQLRRAARRLVFDFDDAIYTTHRGAPADPAAERRLCRTAACADRVIASTDHLARRIAPVQPRITVWPSAVDCRRYAPADADAHAAARGPGSAPLTVGWIGSASTTMYLEPVLPALRTLAASGEIAVRLVGARGIAESAGVTCRPWAYDTELEDLARFDIGIMPLSDDEWARGKAGYKLLQYMACGLPSVASPVGVNAEIVEPGSTGWLARTADDWVDAIRALARDPEGRRRMGQAARRLAESRHSLDVRAPTLAAVIRSVAA